MTSPILLDLAKAKALAQQETLKVILEAKPPQKESEKGQAKNN